MNQQQSAARQMQQQGPVPGVTSNVTMERAPMRVVCCLCGAVLVDGPDDPARTSHGYCPRCMVYELARFLSPSEIGRALASMLREERVGLRKRRMGVCGLRHRAAALAEMRVRW